tara:strand:+ start:11578 stop:12150 length:573 start_codon:yes stop_codon:yes gene_type:complete
MGRIIFSYFEFLFTLVSGVLSFLPNSVIKSLLSFFSSFPTVLGNLIRYILLKAVAINVGSNVYIGRWVVIKYPEKLDIGSNVSIHEFSYIDAQGGIKIGDNTSVAHNCSLISFDHTWQDKCVPIKYNPLVLSAIKIGNDVWVGCGVRILSGVTIPSRVVIAAGSVVTRKSIIDDTPSLYAGAPARKIKEL